LKLYRKRFESNAFKIADDELIAAAIAAALAQYDSIITSSQITKGGQLTPQDLESAMQQYYWGVLCVGAKAQREDVSAKKDFTMSNVDRNISENNENQKKNQRGPYWIVNGPHLKYEQ
jgi:hypothetical protein